MELQEILNLVVNGGGSAVLLYLLLKEQARSQRLEDRLIELSQQMREQRALITQQMQAIRKD